jgi:hypothetical protein
VVRLVRVGDLAIGILAALAGFTAAIWLLLLWVGDRATESFELSPDALDPIRGARDPMAIYDHGPFIAMPEHLKTEDEMVSWMTKDLPKLIAETPRPRV